MYDINDPYTPPNVEDGRKSGNQSHVRGCKSTNVSCRRISFVPDIVADMEEASNLGCLDGFVDVPWEVWRVSPLFGFSYNSAVLERVGTKLASYLSDGGLIEGVSVAVTTVLGLRGCAEDTNAILIQVWSSNRRNPEKPILKAYLLSVNINEVNMPYNRPTILPLMLTWSESNLHVVKLQTGLACLFDCVISPCKFSPNQHLNWILPLWVGFESGSDAVGLEYRFDVSEDRNSSKMLRIHFDLLANEVRHMINDIHDSSEFTMSSQEINAFHMVLNEHLTACCELNLEQHGMLTVVSLPCAKVGPDNKLKIHSKYHVKSILRLLTEFVCPLHTAFPAIEAADIGEVTMNSSK